LQISLVRGDAVYEEAGFEREGREHVKLDREEG
jgi:hypothetical protein